MILNDPATPTVSLGAQTNPTVCGATDGTIPLTFTNVPNGSYTLNYVDGMSNAQTFTGVTVTSGVATITNLGAGVYNDITVAVSGCTSTDDIDVTLNDPATPTVSLGAQTNPTVCGATDGTIPLTFTNVPNGSYTLNYVDGMSNAQTFTGVTVTSGVATITNLGAGVYNDITIAVSGCTSTDDIDVTLTAPATPTVSLGAQTNPTVCGATDGTIPLTFTNVPNGSYTLNYVDGMSNAQTFTGVTVTSGVATITNLGAGVYNDITIAVSGCTSTDDVDVTLTAPATPTVSLGAQTNPTVCGATDGTIPLTFTNVPNGSYTLNYVDGMSNAQTFTGVTVTSGVATITNLGAGVYNDITVAVSGCTSTDDIDVTLNDPATPTVSLGAQTNPTACGATDGTIPLTFTNVPNGSYTLNYVDGMSNAQTFTGVTVTSGVATITNLGAGVYNDITVAVSGCTSTDDIDVTLNDPATPTISLGAQTNPTVCGATDGTIPLTFTNVPNGSYTLNYVDGMSNAQTFTGVTVTSGVATITNLGAGIYNDITIAVSGCTSTDDIDVTLNDPATPTISLGAQTNPTACGATDGTIPLTFTNVPNGSYTLNYVDGMSNAQTFTGVTVTSGVATITNLGAGVYNDITIAVSGCTSTDDIDVTLNDPATPTISLGAQTNPTACGATDGTIPLTFTNVPNGSYTLNYVDGMSNAQTFTGVTVTSGVATITNLGAGVYNDITIAVSGCTSTDDMST